MWPETRQAIEAAGLVIGSVDLPGTGDLLSPDPAKREAVLDTVARLVREAALGPAGLKDRVGRGYLRSLSTTSLGSSSSRPLRAR